MNPTVSIIVPIYNSEKYLKRCVDSILHQEYKNFELFLVDDGSTDASGAICDSYAAADARVRVIHKQNTGVSDSRNTAIRQAAGTYLQFLDSDDWMTPDATKLLVRAAKAYHCDLVISDFYRVVDDRVAQKGDIQANGVLTREEFAAHMMENPADFYYGVLWNKLYRRDLVEKYDLLMDPSISWCEDFLFNLEYILHANVFYALQVPIYYYVRTKGSLASQGMSISKTIKMKFMVFEYYNNFYKNLYDEKDYEKKRLSVYRFFVEAAGDGAVPSALLPGVLKLGEERTAINAAAAAKEGVLAEAYRSRKLLERYLEPCALRNDLSLREIRLLLHLSELNEVHSRRELADFCGMTKSSLSLALQRLSSKNFIKVTGVDAAASKKSGKRALHIELLAPARSILPELTLALNDFDAARFRDFTEEEYEQYLRLSSKMHENIQKVLSI